MIKWLPLLALVILLAGCAQQQSGTETTAPKAPIAQEPVLTAEELCINACATAKAEGSIESGPCLLNPIENTDWVCDVAHEPRTEIDNQPENQCSAFREGTAKHFVEVSTECELIKKY